jgi:hypothetical protein
MSFYHNDPKIGQRIRLFGGQKGVIKASVENFGFPMYEKFNSCSDKFLELFLDISFFLEKILKTTIYRL